MLKLIPALLLSLALLTPFKFIGHLFQHPASVVDVASASTIRITGEAEQETFFGTSIVHYSCTGFAIGPHKVMTAAHCVGNNMRADGDAIKTIWADKYFDLALLEDNILTKKALILRDDPVSRFENLTAIGYGFGWTHLTVLQERVILTNYAVVPDAAKGLIVQGGYIGGMSGGPVVDAKGQVVSIVQRGNAQIGYGVGTLIMKAFLLDADERSPLELPPTLTPSGPIPQLPFSQ